MKVWARDSAKLDAPGVLCFGFVDGNHEPRYIENDFSLVWEALAPGGAVALHDYRGHLPEVTRTIDTLLTKKFLGDRMHRGPARKEAAVRRQKTT